MATYTMTLSDIVDDYTQGYPFHTTKEKIEFARTQLFDFDYPIFDVAYKKIFETNFIRRFYMREIGFETDGYFKFQLESWLLLHMPYFNKMFESELIEYDPLLNSKLNVTHNKLNERDLQNIRDAIQNSTNKETGNVTQIGSADSEQTSDTTGSQDKTQNETSNVTENGSKVDDDFTRKLNADTPDSRLNLTTNDGQGVLEYASNIEEQNTNNVETTNNEADGTKSITGNTDTTESMTGTANSNTNMNGNSEVNGEAETTQNDVLTSKINDIEDFVENRVGKIGTQTYPEMVQLYRESFLRVEASIHREMSQLFMLIY